MTAVTVAGSGGFDFGPIVLKGAMRNADLREALTEWPSVARGIDAAATMSLVVDDHHRTLAPSPIFADVSFADLEDLRFDFVALAKADDALTLTFEDALTCALKRQTSDLSIPAGTMRRGDIVERLLREAGVPYLLDPTSGVVNKVVERKDNANSWDLLGTLASEAGWRRYSNGFQVVVGSDDWISSLNARVELREHTGFVGTINWELDVAQPANRATVDVDVAGWILAPGHPVVIVGQGLADGDWLVESMTRTIGISRQQITLVRQQLVIPEPPPESSAVDSDAGEAGNLPTGSGGSVLTPPAGKYGGTVLSSDQIGFAVRIARVAANRDLGNRGAVLGIMCALQESTLRNLQGGDRDSAGLFQQRPSQGWGTRAQVTNPEYSAGKFFDALVKVPAWASGTPTKVIQAVQRSGYPEAYAKWKDEAEALVQAMVSAANNPTANTTAGGSSGKLAAIASDLAPKVPAYIFGGKNPAKGLDCSGFVAECTKRNGKQLAGSAYTQQQKVAEAGRSLSVAEALRTPGALLFRIEVKASSGKKGSTNHVAISLGNGSTAEARGKGPGVGIFPGAANRQWTHGGLWP